MCKNQRIQHHKLLLPVATRGKSSMGWFFGCKLHLATNQFSEIVASALSNGYISEIRMFEQLVEGLQVKLYAIVAIPVMN